MKIVALVCFCFLYSSSPCRGLETKFVENVYELLWVNNFDIAEDTINTEFMKQMQSGTLQAEKYMSFTLQDINYIIKVTEMLGKMSAKTTQPEDIRDFINGRYESYKKFADSMINDYDFTAFGIKETPAMENYLSDYKTFMEDPLDFIVALLPCARLWVWMANEASIPPNSAYYTWKRSNMDGHPEKYRDLLNKYLGTTDGVNHANKVFRTQMMNEFKFFSSSLEIHGFCTTLGNNEVECFDKNTFVNV